jgi:hypothetical protein
MVYHVSILELSYIQWEKSCKNPIQDQRVS